VILIDHGFLRLRRSKTAVESVPRHYNIPLVPCRRGRHVPSQRLQGPSDPEQAQDHRPLFIYVFEAEAKKIGAAEFFAQGTLYPE